MNEHRITAELYAKLRARLAELGHGSDYTWAQNVSAPNTPEDFAAEYTWVVLNSGMRNTVARKIMDRVWPLVVSGQPMTPAFGHVGKRRAIEATWQDRGRLWCEAVVLKDAELVDWCESLPWIGPITKHHLAKNLGADVAKPDRWLVRLADAEHTTVDELCARLARETGDRVATVDVVLWRACAVGVLAIDNGGVIFRSGDVGR